MQGDEYGFLFSVPFRPATSSVFRRFGHVSTEKRNPYFPSQCSPPTHIPDEQEFSRFPYGGPSPAQAHQRSRIRKNSGSSGGSVGGCTGTSTGSSSLSPSLRRHQAFSGDSTTCQQRRGTRISPVNALHLRIFPMSQNSAACTEVGRFANPS